ncbi:caspase family protein [Streptomyces sp. NPDC096012]|uniref:caspase family protein n=1 Tax=Streptomyces sp. NPDC096012 TaxID=3155684 RepID=UPI00336A0D34
MNEERRLLLTAAVTRYVHCPEWDRPELADDQQRMVDLFTEDFGYRHVPVLGLSPTADQLRDALRDFSMSPDRRPDDYVALYVAGHGDFLEDRESRKEHVLLTADADPRDLRHRAVKTAHLAEWLLAGTMIRRLLLILDTCYSGGGGGDAAREALWSLSDVGGGATADIEGTGVVLVTATRPNQMAQPGAFTTAFARAARHLASGGYSQPQLRVDSVLNVLKADGATPTEQTATCHLLGLEGEQPAFLPNPRFRRELLDLDLMLQDQLRQADLRAEELRNRFVPATQWFTGRHRALSELAQWLNEPGDDDRARVVTGNPGSGKTALLGLLTTLSDAERRPTVPRGGLPEAIPDIGVIDAAIYAGNLSTDQVLAGIAAAADVRASAVGDLLDELDRREHPLTILVDALDEAGDPEGLIASLLQPLLTRGQRRIRLLLGTRPHLLPAFRTRKRIVSLDLDDETYADPDSLRLYTRRVLTESRPDSPYRGTDGAAVDAVAAAIAEAAQTSFLVARIAAQTHAALPSPPAAADPAWRRGLPRLAGEAMRADLELRLGERQQQARELLLPLAYAQGSGLPWEDIWPRLATALARGTAYTNEDLLWLRRSAGSYVVETRAGDESAYRLYHQALGEYLREGRDHAEDQRAIAEALRGHVPTSGRAVRDWERSHRYIRTHLVTHAAQGGQIDDLLTDPRFLLVAVRPQLLAALPGARGVDAYSAATAYRQAVHHLRGKAPEEHAAYLALAAHCAGARMLAAAVADSGLARPWSVRWASWRPEPPHRSLTGHTANVVSVATGQVGGHPRVASGGADGLVRVWDLTRPSESAKFTGHRGRVHVALGEVDGRAVVISGGEDRSVRVWDVDLGRESAGPLTGHTDYVSAVALAEVHGQPVAVSGSFDGTVRVWNLQTGDPIGDPLRGHESYVSAVALGELDAEPVVVSGSYDGALRVWSLKTGRTLNVLRGHSSYVSCAALGELDGRPVVVSGSDDRTLRVWDLATGTAVGEPFTGHSGRIESVALAEFDGRPVVVSGSYDDTVRVWDLRTGQSWGKPFGGHGGRVHSVAVEELDGWPVVVSGGDDHTIRLWDLAAGLVSGKPFTGHTHRVQSVALGELDGRPIVVSGSADRTVRVWDMASGQSMGMPLVGHEGWVLSVVAGTFDDTPVAVSCGEDRGIRVWNLLTGQPMGSPLTERFGYVSCLALGRWNGRPVIAAGTRRSVRIWDPGTGETVSEPFMRHDGYVSAVAIGEWEERCVVVSGSYDRTVRVWDLDARRAVGPPLTGHEGLVHSVAIGTLNARQVIVSGSADGTVRIWDLVTGEPAGAPLTGHNGRVRAVATGELDGVPIVVSGGADGALRVTNLATGEVVGEPLAESTGEVLCVTVGVMQGRPVVVSGNTDHSIQVRELSAGAATGRWNANEPAERFVGHADIVSAVATSAAPHGGVAVSGSHDCTLRVWDLATGTPVGGELVGHTDWIMDVTTGRLEDLPIAVSAGDRTVRIWDLTTRKQHGAPLTGHDSYVSAVTLAESGAGTPLVISGSYDTTIRRWNPTTGTVQGDPLIGHTDWITALAADCPGGVPILVSGSADGTARMWNPATGQSLGEPLTGHNGNVTSVAVATSSQGFTIVTGGEDGTVLAWGPQYLTGAPADEDALQHHSLRRRGTPTVLLSCDAPITTLAFSPAGDILAAGAGSETALIRVGDGHRREIELGARVLGLSFANDHLLVVATEQGLVAVNLKSW